MNSKSLCLAALLAVTEMGMAKHWAAVCTNERSGSVATADIPAVPRQTAHEALLKEAESRFRAIYERDEFRPRRFQAEWLPDSSGYTVLESAPEAKEQVRARYDVASGQRTVLDASRQEKQRRSGDFSPDGKRAVLAENGNLFVRDLEGDQRIPLTKSEIGRAHV